jgi:hypothetical protein
LPALLLFQIIFLRQQHDKFQIKLFLSFFLPLMFLGFWALYHYPHTGWYFFSPLRNSTDEHLSGGGMMVRQFIYVLWKFADFGMIIPILFFIITTTILFIKKKIDVKLKQLIFLISAIMICLMLFMVPLSNPIGHRYFIIPSLLLILTCVYLLSFFKREFVKYFIIGFFAVSLITGNFWIYPERFGNGWDSSLKVLPFFKMEKTIHEYTKELNVQLDQIAAGFPLFSDLKYTYLEENNSRFADIDDKPMNEYKYILYSNVSNNFPLETKKTIEKSWIPLKTFRSGMVYIIVYRNPTL